MSNSSILLLLTCVTCTDSADSFILPSTPDCSAVEASVQPQQARQSQGKLLSCTHSVSTPEIIPAFLTQASRPVAAVQAISTEGAIAPRPAPPEPFILPETFTKPSTTANSPPPNRSSDLVRLSPDELPGLLKLGSQGEAVSRLQEKLQQLDYYTGAVDGVYGQQTFAAVAKFQQTHGLTVDGIAGPLTWARLQTLLETTAPFTQNSREATAILNPSNTRELTTATATEAQTLNQTTNRLSEAERGEPAGTAGEIAGSAPTSAENQSPPTQDADFEQPLPEQESQQTPDFVFDTSPSGGPFYLWIGAWAIVYIGGMLYIFKDSINSKLGLKWGKDNEKEQQDIELPMLGEPSSMDPFISALDYDQSPESSDGFGPAVPNPAEPAKQNWVNQHDPPLHFSREVDRSSPTAQNSQADAKPLNDSIKPPIFSLLEKLAYESPKLANQELTPVWAEGGVVEPLRGLFSDLPHPLGSHSSERRRNKAIAPPPYPTTSQPIQPSPNQADASSTLIATLPAEDPDTQKSYTYLLLDNAKGYFLLKGNELRIYDEALVQIEADVDHAITLRRTDAEGTQVDKSFVVNFTKTDDDDTAEMARSA